MTGQIRGGFHLYARHFTAVFCMLAFTSSQFQLAAYASPDTASPASFTSFNADKLILPEDLGTVNDSSAGADGPAVVLIQNAHAVPDAQRNIQGLIEHLQKKYGPGPVAVEGASSALDAQFLRSYPDKRKLAQILEEYFESGELTGTVAAAIHGDPSAEFSGLEDLRLYQEGILLFRKAVGKESANLEKISFHQKRLEYEKASVYSKTLLSADRALDHFYKNDADFFNTLKELSKIRRPEKGSDLDLLLNEAGQDDQHKQKLESSLNALADQLHRKLKALPSSKHQAQALIQFQKAFQDYRTSKVTPDSFALAMKELVAENRLPLILPGIISSAVSHERKMRDLEGTRILKQFEIYAAALKESLFRNPTERNLDAKFRRLYLFEKLAKLELTRDEWNELARVNAEEWIVARGDLREPIEFYDNALSREAALFQNLMKLVHSNAQFTIHDTRFARPIVMVAGGFHTAGLIARLKEKNISYALVSPKINSIPPETHYRDYMNGDVSWKNYFAAEQGKVSMYKAFVRALRDKLLSHQSTKSPGHQKWETDQAAAGDVVTDVPVTLKSWRDQIIRDLAQQERVADAGKYTQFLDELVTEKPNTDLAEREKRISDFVGKLRALDDRGELTGANLLKALQPAAAEALNGPISLASSDWINAAALQTNSRSELRTDSGNVYESPSVAKAYTEAYGNAVPVNVADLLTAFASDLPRDGTILDAGTGPGKDAGWLSHFFRSNNTNQQIIGVDSSESMLDIARQMHPDIPFFKMDLEQLDIEDESVSGIVTDGVLHYSTPEKGRLIAQEFRRVIKPGGKLLVIVRRPQDKPDSMKWLEGVPEADKKAVQERYFHGYETDELRVLLQQAGFNADQVEEVPGNPKWIYALASTPARSELRDQTNPNQLTSVGEEMARLLREAYAALNPKFASDEENPPLPLLTGDVLNALRNVLAASGLFRMEIGTASEAGFADILYGMSLELGLGVGAITWNVGSLPALSRAIQTEINSRPAILISGAPPLYGRGFWNILSARIFGFDQFHTPWHMVIDEDSKSPDYDTDMRTARAQGYEAVEIGRLPWYTAFALPLLLLSFFQPLFPKLAWITSGLFPTPAEQIRRAIETAVKERRTVFIKVPADVVSWKTLPSTRPIIKDKKLSFIDRILIRRLAQRYVSQIARAERPVIYAGSKFSRDPELPKLLEQFSALTSVPIANSWSAKGLFDGRLPNHIGSYNGEATPWRATKVYVEGSDFVLRLGDSLIPLQSENGVKTLRFPRGFTERFAGSASWRGGQDLGFLIKAMIDEAKKRNLVKTSARSVLNLPNLPDQEEYDRIKDQTLTRPLLVRVLDWASQQFPQIRYVTAASSFWFYGQEMLTPVVSDYRTGEIASGPGTVAGMAMGNKKILPLGITGDGGMAAYGFPLILQAAKSNLRMVMIVLDDNQYKLGTKPESLHEEARTALAAIAPEGADYVKVYEGLGAKSVRVTTGAALLDALDQAEKYSGPTVIVIPIDPNEPIHPSVQAIMDGVGGIMGEAHTNTPNGVGLVPLIKTIRGREVPPLRSELRMRRNATPRSYESSNEFIFKEKTITVKRTVLNSWVEGGTLLSRRGVLQILVDRELKIEASDREALKDALSKLSGTDVQIEPVTSDRDQVLSLAQLQVSWGRNRQRIVVWNNPEQVAALLKELLQSGIALFGIKGDEKFQPATGEEKSPISRSELRIPFDPLEELASSVIASKAAPQFIPLGSIDKVRLFSQRLFEKDPNAKILISNRFPIRNRGDDEKEYVYYANYVDGNWEWTPLEEKMRDVRILGELLEDLQFIEYIAPFWRRVLEAIFKIWFALKEILRGRFPVREGKAEDFISEVFQTDRQRMILRRLDFPILYDSPAKLKEHLDLYEEDDLSRWKKDGVEIAFDIIWDPNLELYRLEKYPVKVPGLPERSELRVSPEELDDFKMAEKTPATSLQDVRVLVVEDVPSQSQALKDALLSAGVPEENIEFADSAATFLNAMRFKYFHIVIADRSLSGTYSAEPTSSGLGLVRALRAKGVDLGKGSRGPVLIYNSSEERDIAANHFDYLPLGKGKWELNPFRYIFNQALQAALSRSELRQASDLDELILGTALLAHGGPFDILNQVAQIRAAVDSMQDEGLVSSDPLLNLISSLSQEVLEFAFLYAEFSEKTEKLSRLQLQGTDVADLSQTAKNAYHSAIVKVIENLTAAGGRIQNLSSQYTPYPALQDIQTELSSLIENLTLIHFYLSEDISSQAQPINLNTWLNARVWRTKINTFSGETEHVAVMKGGDEDLTVQAVPELLHVVIERIISNGFHAIRKKKESSVDGKIQLAARRISAEEAAVTIVSPGHIDLDKLKVDPETGRIPFYLDYSRKHFNHGIGLPFVISAVEKMGGSVEVRNIKSEGHPQVEFTVRIPLANRSELRQDVDTSKPGAFNRNGSSGSSVRLFTREEKLMAQLLIKLKALEPVVNKIMGKSELQPAEWRRLLLKDTKQAAGYIGAYRHALLFTDGAPSPQSLLALKILSDWLSAARKMNEWNLTDRIKPSLEQFFSQASLIRDLLDRGEFFRLQNYTFVDRGIREDFLDEKLVWPEGRSSLDGIGHVSGLSGSPNGAAHPGGEKAESVRSELRPYIPYSTSKEIKLGALIGKEWLVDDLDKALRDILRHKDLESFTAVMFRSLRMQINRSSWFDLEGVFQSEIKNVVNSLKSGTSTSRIQIGIREFTETLSGRKGVMVVLTEMPDDNPLAPPGGLGKGVPKWHEPSRAPRPTMFSSPGRSELRSDIADAEAYAQLIQKLSAPQLTAEAARVIGDSSQRAGLLARLRSPEVLYHAEALIAGYRENSNLDNEAARSLRKFLAMAWHVNHLDRSELRRTAEKVGREVIFPGSVRISNAEADRAVTFIRLEGFDQLVQVLKEVAGAIDLSGENGVDAAVITRLIERFAAAEKNRAGDTAGKSSESSLIGFIAPEDNSPVSQTIYEKLAESVKSAGIRQVMVSGKIPEGFAARLKGFLRPGNLARRPKDLDAAQVLPIIDSVPVPEVPIRSIKSIDKGTWGTGTVFSTVFIKGLNENISVAAASIVIETFFADYLSRHAKPEQLKNADARALLRAQFLKDAGLPVSIITVYGNGGFGIDESLKGVLAQLQSEFAAGREAQKSA